MIRETRHYLSESFVRTHSSIQSLSLSFKMIWLFAFAVILVGEVTSNYTEKSMGYIDELVHFINEQSGASWKAARPTRFKSVEHFKLHLGALAETPELRNSRRPTIKHYASVNDLPESFDARKQWPNCRSIGEIRDQSSCYSCWAFGAVEAMSDRVCIHSNGRMRPRLSALDPLSCCNYCGYGCLGGFPSMAWDFWWRSGIVTGGSVEQQFGCLPYPFPRCSHGEESRGLTPCPADLYPTPQCSKYCRSGYVKTYEKDKFYGKLISRS
ncbi:Cathepsin B [Fasciola hepatica]|uniref:Cathepsin B n=1 Tax=Fasciola hepatica TaxID=6192 RepID=A0A4E0QUT5_FASHE|nr:Cathepsin B [Fasciola hepatica]